MRTYENKDELKNEINKSFAKYISEFNDIPEHLKDKRIDEIDAAMTGGSGFAGGKGRIYAFFMENHTDKEKVRLDRKSTRLNSSHNVASRMPSSA